MQEIISKIRPNIDEYGLLVHFERDRFGVMQKNGGDSCQRTCTYYIFLSLLNKWPMWMDFQKALDKLKTPHGYIRHPEKGYHCGVEGYTLYECWSNPKNFSEDQGRALIVATQVHGFQATSQDIFIDILKNFSRFPNGGVCFLAEYGTLIRGCGWWFLWPLLWVTDAWLVLSNALTVVRHLISSHGSGVTYTDGYINGLLLSLSTLEMPTPFGWLARKIIRIKLQDAWDYYFRHEGAPQLNLFIPLVKGFL